MLTSAELSDDTRSPVLAIIHVSEKMFADESTTRSGEEAKASWLPRGDRHELRQQAAAQGYVASDAQQICRRMRELLRGRLQQLVDEYRRQHSAARAKRKALTDPRYLAYIEQMVDVCSKAQAARIRYETYLSYYEVR